MNDLTQILLGFQIGFLSVAIITAVRIMLIKITPNFPYQIAIVALVLMVVQRVNIIFNFLAPFVATLGTTITSILWLVFFINIHILINKKYD